MFFHAYASYVYMKKIRNLTYIFKWRLRLNFSKYLIIKKGLNFVLLLFLKIK